jgi:hypothetical protein
VRGSTARRHISAVRFLHTRRLWLLEHLIQLSATLASHSDMDLGRSRTMDSPSCRATNDTSVSSSYRSFVPCGQHAAIHPSVEGSVGGQHRAQPFRSTLQAHFSLDVADCSMQMHLGHHMGCTRFGQPAGASHALCLRALPSSCLYTRMMELCLVRFPKLCDACSCISTDGQL